MFLIFFCKNGPNKTFKTENAMKAIFKAMPLALMLALTGCMKKCGHQETEKKDEARAENVAANMNLTSAPALDQPAQTEVTKAETPAIEAPAKENTKTEEMAPTEQTAPEGEANDAGTKQVSASGEKLGDYLGQIYRSLTSGTDNQNSQETSEM